MSLILPPPPPRRRLRRSEAAALLGLLLVLLVFAAAALAHWHQDPIDAPRLSPVGAGYYYFGRHEVSILLPQHHRKMHLYHQDFFTLFMPGEGARVAVYWVYTIGALSLLAFWVWRRRGALAAFLTTLLATTVPLILLAATRVAHAPVGVFYVMLTLVLLEERGRVRPLRLLLLALAALGAAMADTVSMLALLMVALWASWQVQGGEAGALFFASSEAPSKTSIRHRIWRCVSWRSPVAWWRRGFPSWTAAAAPAAFFLYGLILFLTSPEPFFNKLDARAYHGFEQFAHVAEGALGFVPLALLALCPLAIFLYALSLLRRRAFLLGPAAAIMLSAQLIVAALEREPDYPANLFYASLALVLFAVELFCLALDAARRARGWWRAPRGVVLAFMTVLLAASVAQGVHRSYGLSEREHIAFLQGFRSQEIEWENRLVFMIAETLLREDQGVAFGRGIQCALECMTTGAPKRFVGDPAAALEGGDMVLLHLHEAWMLAEAKAEVFNINGRFFLYRQARERSVRAFTADWPSYHSAWELSAKPFVHLAKPKPEDKKDVDKADGKAEKPKPADGAPSHNKAERKKLGPDQLPEPPAPITPGNGVEAPSELLDGRPRRNRKTGPRVHLDRLHAPKELRRRLKTEKATQP
ncbi:MAG: hypothetical protein RBU37_16920 [Myxococcota bacterium]|jgi:hypothetical protein|nr:hypothetical protein [Myxococcota bacterium]